MSQRSRGALALLLGLVAFGLLLGLVGCGGGGDEETTTSGFDVTRYVGTYAGTWTSSSTGDSGPFELTIKADEPAGKATLSIDFGGRYLGLDDPPPATTQGTFDDSGATFAGSSVLFGTYDVDVAADGAMEGTFTDLAAGAVPKLTYTGTLTPQRLDADYEVTFKDGATSKSVVEATKTTG